MAVFGSISFGLHLSKKIEVMADILGIPPKTFVVNAVNEHCSLLMDEPEMKKMFEKYLIDQEQKLRDLVKNYYEKETPHAPGS